MGLLILLTLGLLFSCSGALVQSSSSDMFAPSPDPLVALLPGAPYAAYLLHHSDVAIRTTRHNPLGSQWRNYYDDHMQFVSYSLQLAMRCDDVMGRSRPWGEMLTVSDTGALGTVAIALSVKDDMQRMRPDGSIRNSFPLRHTATAFLGAEPFSLGCDAGYPLLAHIQYLSATSVAFGRMANNRHWYSDVLWGGLIGATMARVEYLASDLIFSRYTPTVSSQNPDQYFYVSLFYSRNLFGGTGCLGTQLDWQTPSLNYAAELSLRPGKECPMFHGDLIVGTPLHQWRYLSLQRSCGIGIGHDRAASKRTYARLQVGLKVLPRLRYLDKLGLFLRPHCESYRQSYLTLGLPLRHSC